MDRLMYHLLLLFVFVMPVGCALLEPKATLPDADLADDPSLAQVAFVKAEPLPPEPAQRQVVAGPKPVPITGQLKPAESDEEICPICVSEGIPPEKQKPLRQHKTHELIDFANRQARKGPELHGYINGVQVYDYIPGALFQVYTAPTRVTSVMLHPNEKLTTYAVGDTVHWTVEATTSGQGLHERSIVLVKPATPGLSTNLVITTTKYTYLLELHSYKETYMAAVSWQYPQETPVAMTQQAQQRQRQAAQDIVPQAHLQDLYFQYEITRKQGEPLWKPVRVFDDRRKTYIEFLQDLTTIEAPALFILTSRQQPQSLTYRVQGNYYIVDRLFERAELRLGEKESVIVGITRQEPHTVQTAAQPHTN